MAYKVYFYRSSRGEREVRTFLRNLSFKSRAKCLHYLKKLKQDGTRLPSNIVKHLEGEIWEVRPEYGGIEYRFFFFLYRDVKIGIVSAAIKKQQKTKRAHIEKAMRLAEEMRANWEEMEHEKSC